MKISIWQQFSSNHSSFFLVIGKFKTIDEATQVADEIRKLLRDIARWKEQADLGEIPLPPAHSIYVDASPPEEAFLKAWGLDANPLQYAHGITDDLVQQFDSLVFVSEDFLNRYSWTGPAPFDELMEKLGAEVAVTSEVRDIAAEFTITVIAPDDATAQQFDQSIERKQKDYGDGKLHHDFHIPDALDEWMHGTVQRDEREFVIVAQTSFEADEILKILRHIRALGFAFEDISVRTVEW